jgi:hypothetical protein
VTAVALLLGGGPASAQSAADKATAREAATQGIGLYRAGKYADALDRLKRAQALYDAPVHLLYIARCQAKLAQLVEAAENYRLLDRYVLPSDAPGAWKSAVDDGRKELAEVEPRVPKLKIATDPANVEGATLTIDGAAVSSAVVGIERPTNPGKHHLTISAPNFSPAEADTTLTEGQSAEVTLHLAPGAGAAAAPAPSTTVAAQPVPAPNAEPEPQPQGRSLVGFLGGLRLGVGLPVGNLLHINVTGAPERDIAASDAFGAGGALEIHAGVRIARYFTPVLFIEGEALSAGGGLFPDIKTTISNTRAGAFGIGVMIGSAPGKLGGFGELDFVPVSSFDLTTTAPLQPGKTCDIAAKGSAIRFGGGANFPVLDWLHITPVFLATLGTFTHLDSSGTCDAYPSSGDIASANRRTHGMLFFGVGGDVVLGRDK